MKQTRPKCSIVDCSGAAVFIEEDKSYTCCKHHMITHYPDMVKHFYGEQKTKSKKKYTDLLPPI